MNIVFLTRLYSPHIGGVEKHVYEISKRLKNKGDRITIITENHGWKDEDNINGLKIVRIHVGKEGMLKKFKVWIEIWKHMSILSNADIIHCHDVFFWILPYKMFLLRKKIYVTFHGYESFPISYKARIQRKIAERLTSGNICIGDFISKWYKTIPTYVSYGGVEKQKRNITN